VYIEFRNNRLEKCFLDRTTRRKTWKGKIPDKYVEAVNLLKAVEQPSHLGAFPQFDYEPLTQDRKGQHSLKLGRRERLIFTVHEGRDALTARIEEVDTTHYGH